MEMKSIVLASLLAVSPLAMSNTVLDPVGNIQGSQKWINNETGITAAIGVEVKDVKDQKYTIDASVGFISALGLFAGASNKTDFQHGTGNLTSVYGGLKHDVNALTLYGQFKASYLDAKFKQTEPHVENSGVVYDTELGATYRFSNDIRLGAKYNYVETTKLEDKTKQNRAGAFVEVPVSFGTNTNEIFQNWTLYGEVTNVDNQKDGTKTYTEGKVAFGKVWKSGVITALNVTGNDVEKRPVVGLNLTYQY